MSERNNQKIKNKIEAACAHIPHLHIGARILVGVSGGADSLFLAYILQQMGYEIGIAHCNFQLRGEESEADEAHVIAFAQQLQVPMYVQKCDTKTYCLAHKVSTQAGARALRYAYFDFLMHTHNFAFCATAHHADDQAETLLMSLLKGNSPQILKGIPMQRQQYIRPLLSLRKSEILDEMHNLPFTYRTDSSNLHNDYTRNYIRNVIMPSLNEINTDVTEQLLRKNELYQLQYQFIKYQLKDYIAGSVLNFSDILSQFDAAFLPIFIWEFVHENGFLGHVAHQATELIEAQSGKFVQMGNTKCVRTHLGLEIVTMIATHEAIVCQKTEIPATFTFENKRIVIEEVPASEVRFGQKNCFYFDINTLQFPLQFRLRKSGDVMHPFGLKGMQKLKDICINEKYSAQSKQDAIVIEDSTQIIAFEDFRSSETTKITANTQNILSITIQHLSI